MICKKKIKEIQIKDIDLISEVSEIKEGKEILIAGASDLSGMAEEAIKSDLSCLDICRKWAREHGINFVSSMASSEMNIDEDFIKSFDISIITTYFFIPATRDDGKKVIILNDPFNLEKIEELRFMCEYEENVVLAYANTGTISSEITKIKTIIQKNNMKIQLIDGAEKHSKEFVDIEDMSSDSESAAVYFVNNALKESVINNASDIHFESTATGIHTRIRVNGQMRDQFHASKSIGSSILARIKTLSRLDASETRRPQDGRIKIKISNQLIDLRVSSMPTLHGERAVIRFLGGTEGLKRKAYTSYFLPCAQEILEDISNTPEGIALVVGPTGSGKTTTLYSILEMMKKDERNVITIEDPVEKEVEGISQIPINVNIGFDFGDALKHVLRQDPDVILIGEIRDETTARSAVQAAITGHFVLSTLHAPDAKSAIPRLMDMNARALLISTSLKYILSQRLIRKLCFGCKIKEGDKYIENSQGCVLCKNTGFEGRVAVVEYMKVKGGVKESISRGESILQTWRTAQDLGLCKSMSEYGKELLSLGLVSDRELDRVISSD